MVEKHNGGGVRVGRNDSTGVAIKEGDKIEYIWLEQQIRVSYVTWLKEFSWFYPFVCKACGADTQISSVKINERGEQ